MSLGFTEIILIALFILIVFGAKRIPELARAMGRASYEFKKAKESLSLESQELMTERKTRRKKRIGRKPGKRHESAGKHPDRAPGGVAADTAQLCRRNGDPLSGRVSDLPLGDRYAGTLEFS